MRRFAVCLSALVLIACKRGEETSSMSARPKPIVSITAETDHAVHAALAAEGCNVTRTDGRAVWMLCGDAGGEDSINLETSTQPTAASNPTRRERRACSVLRSWASSPIRAQARSAEHG